jgi:ketosteroid isomerase-like protein
VTTKPKAPSPETALAISACIIEFAYLVDHGHATACETLFTEDAQLTFGPGTPKPGTLAGIAAIRAFLGAREAQAHVTTRHTMGNIRLHQRESGEVEAQSVLTLFRSETAVKPPTVTFIADIDELYTKQPSGEWRIKERLITPVFAHPA